MQRTFILFLFLLQVLIAVGQDSKVTVSGLIKESSSDAPIPYVSINIKQHNDTGFVAGTITGENGRFSITGIKPGRYRISFTMQGFKNRELDLPVGQLSAFLELGNIELTKSEDSLEMVTVGGRKDGISSKMDKKVFTVAANISQSGGSVLDALKMLPGITNTQDGKLKIRGSDQVMILIDGKQTALTGFGGQSGLANLPASAIASIEVINNPSAKYDAAGNAGIINIIYKKEKNEGFNGTVGMSTGAGALWIKKENLPGIRDQYQFTPKLNPSVSLNFRSNKVNVFFQGDNLYTKTLNKNEFADRFYDNGETVRQQTKRNRTTNIVTLKSGIDWAPTRSDNITVWGLVSSEKILDRGDEPFFKRDLSERLRLWQFLEDELKTTVTASSGWQHKFKKPGQQLNAGLNYTFHREDEKYFFTNILPAYTGLDSFKLLSDEHVFDLTIDYIQPLRYGRFETGLKLRRRYIPVNMDFKPGLNSPLDTSAGGYANYGETIPAIYGNYVFENNKFEIEGGLRLEYVRLEYTVNPGHPTYKSDGYNYTQPFPNLRFAFKINKRDRLTLFYNRRVDRPNEVDIRIFPKYDDAEIIKVGNPALRPQFTNSVEAGYKTSWHQGSLFGSLYHKNINATIARIGSVATGSNLIYNIFQNAGNSYNTGIEFSITQNITKLVTINVNLNGYKNIIDAFSVLNKYPVSNVFTAPRESIFSGNLKMNLMMHLPGKMEVQLAASYQAPDLIPQGKIYSRFSMDAGLKKLIQAGKAELFVNATDLGNSLKIKREVRGNGFRYISTDYYETQVIRVGYSYKF